VKVLAISGSLRRDSHNTKLLRTAEELLPPSAELISYEGMRELPPYDADDDTQPAPRPVQRLRDAIDEANAILIATPEYNASIPGALKNAIDWASRPVRESALRFKPAAVIGATTGQFGAVWAQADLRRVLRTAGARVIERDLPVAKANEAFDEDGRLASIELREQLQGILDELISEAEQAAEAEPIAA